MQTIPRMTRLKEHIDEAVLKLAAERGWYISQALSQIISNSPMISNYLTLDEKNTEKCA